MNRLVFHIKYALRASALCCFSLSTAGAQAASTLVAVSANFGEVAAELETIFETETGYDVILSIGSTGQLYAQITNGAPFDILLAADQNRPALLEENGGIKGSRFTYAIGLLTVWSADPTLITKNGINDSATINHFAIANPDLAPYGHAARQALITMGQWDMYADNLVMGQNISQTFSMIATGNADVGIVAKSYVLSPRNTQTGSFFDIPADLYDPIKQDAILLEHGANNPAAIAFLDFLQSETARNIIVTFGYRVN